VCPLASLLTDVGDLQVRDLEVVGAEEVLAHAVQALVRVEHAAVHVHEDEVVVEAEGREQALGRVDDERDEGPRDAVVLVRLEPLVQLEGVACVREWH
jgi:hypothetical protein